ncbi:hypothetical protein HQ346_20670 [Rhodococcus sp. BP-252]|uniref:hypothetical protein n=1 Tax=unclassified Rhodococcus (in: high G+C Gram-positive bacteria) TaxID=192944 RepID=UPI001C9AAA8C|nr:MULTISPECIES: hypothetical protein [unclassified Rhodococcus (in: high G+C Gram-positive bacteria)]MBY6414112.1 hypothetical protein [Rhodococcus sp. BP-320]MBY6418913.1 hypothetical protein [Rhodococcus sp. BP-321]MBY6423610.1 hypothetical protein [Rhodococcus sp. BP-324]MBY6428947.1 hypothetical protein [Rhodococcus sp. BP-323]MBY6433952.1 hypothetical protein [Rhodococcus sp. BP-322]
MSGSIAEVRAWNPTFLLDAADGLKRVQRSIRSERDNVVSEQNVLAESWHGDAAVAAAERVVWEASTLASLADELSRIGEQFESGFKAVNAARSNLLDLVDDLLDRGFDVDDTGSVTADRATASLRAVAGPLAEDAVLTLQIRTQEATVAVATALREADDAARGVCDVLRSQISTLQELSARTVGGTVVENEGGGFSWKPDVPALVAGTVISGMAEATGEGLRTAAASAADDLAYGIGRRLGPAGAVLGTVPAIVNDIEGGMDPTKAIVTESAGTLGSIGASALAGAAMGIFFPGAGTAVGLIVGLSAGAIAAYAVPKLGQRWWE